MMLQVRESFIWSAWVSSDMSPSVLRVVSVCARSPRRGELGRRVQP